MIHIDQEADYVPKRLIRRSGVIVIATIAVSIGATIAVAGGRVLDVLRVTSERPARVDATLFRMPSEAEQLSERADQRLRSYGWVDRTAGTIHVPLDVAIEQYLSP